MPARFRLGFIALCIAAILSVSLTASAAGPFVEPEAIAIHSFSGEAVGDHFGWVAEKIGDINGDGVTEIIIPAIHSLEGGVIAGKVYVYSARDGVLLATAVGHAYEQFGWSAAGAGDVNDDGVSDYIVGGPGSAIAPIPFKGRVVVFSGADHSVLHELIGADGARFGASVSGAGDVNGDGHDDFFVGAPRDGSSLPLSGRVYLFSGADGSIIWTRDGLGAQHFLGIGAGLVGDVNGDGVPDQVASARLAGNQSKGEAYVFSGVDGQIIYTLKPVGLPGSPPTFGEFFASGAGDVNNDDIPDIFIGDYNATRGGTSGTGRAYLFSGADGSPLHVLNAEKKGDGFGPGRGTGDVNGDGYGDLIVAAYTSSAGTSFGGRAYVISGREGSVLRTITGSVTGDNLGVDALGVDDVNGDGRVDYLITAVGNSFAGTDTGHAYIVAGTPFSP